MFLIGKKYGERAFEELKFVPQNDFSISALVELYNMKKSGTVNVAQFYTLYFPHFIRGYEIKSRPFKRLIEQWGL